MKTISVMVTNSLFRPYIVESDDLTISEKKKHLPTYNFSCMKCKHGLSCQIKLEHPFHIPGQPSSSYTNVDSILQLSEPVNTTWHGKRDKRVQFKAPGFQKASENMYRTYIHRCTIFRRTKSTTHKRVKCMLVKMDIAGKIWTLTALMQNIFFE